MGKKKKRKKEFSEKVEMAESTGRAAFPHGGILTKPFFAFALIAALALLVYSNTFSVPFQWDEETFIKNNHIVMDLGYFLDPSSARGLEYYEDLVSRPVAYFSFALNYALHGLDVRGYHAVNFAVHVLNGLLVYLLVALTLRTPFLAESRLGAGAPYAALFSALLFVAHPLQTEAVTYVFQRLASLVAFFYLLSLSAYAGSRLTEKARARYGLYALSLVSAVLAMKTKENAFTLPVVLALYELFFFSGPRGRRVLRLVPFVLTMALIPWALLSVAGAGSGGGAGPEGFVDVGTWRHFEGSRWHYLFTQFAVIVTYLRLLVLPVGQNLVHDYPLYRTLMEPRVVASFLFLASFFAFGLYLVWRSRKGGEAARLRLYGFGILWFFITISIESSFLPLPMLMDEYRMYLPVTGLFVAAAVAAFSFKGKGARRSAAAALAIVVLVFAAAAYARNGVWHTKVGLWEDVVKKSPSSNSVRNSLGKSYLEVERYEEAIVQFNKAIELRPGHFEALNNRGNAFMAKDMLEESVIDYEKALTIKPGFVEALNNLGAAYFSMGRYDDAAERFSASIRLDPMQAEPLNNLGAVYYNEGNYDRAIESFEASLKIDPRFTDAMNNLGNAYFSKGMIKEAVERYERVLALDPGIPETNNNLGIAYLAMGRLDGAIERFERVVSLKPTFIDARLNLGAAYYEKGLVKEARRELSAVLRGRPGDPRAAELLSLIEQNEKEGASDVK